MKTVCFDLLKITAIYSYLFHILVLNLSQALIKGR